MDRRHFVKTSIMAALTNPIHAMTRTNSTKSKNRKKGHIAVVGAGAFGGWTAYHLLRKYIYEKIVFYNNYKVCPEFSRIIH